MTSQSPDGFIWPAGLMGQIRAVRAEWRRLHDAIIGATSPVLAEVERMSCNTEVPAALRSAPDAARVARDLVPLVRAAAGPQPPDRPEVWRGHLRCFRDVDQALGWARTEHLLMEQLDRYRPPPRW